MSKDHHATNRELDGKTALVTGASSGFGAHFARQLAALGCNLVITARRLDRLTALRDEICAASPVRVDILVQDLGQPGAAQLLFDQVTALGLEVDLLVNNAGFGLKGKFLELPLDRQMDILRLNVGAVQELTWLFARPMVNRGYGEILFVTSVAEYQPSPNYAVYAASKVYVSYLAHALHYELHGTGVNCLVVAPGISPTEFSSIARQGRSLMHLGEMPPEEVVRRSLDALLQGKEKLVPGWQNRLATSLAIHAPRRLKTWSAALLVRD